MDRINSQLLTRYIDSFYGYGNYSGRYWFVGMEEGGGLSAEENAARMTTWDQRGGHELEDLVEYHRDIGVTRWFTRHPPIQPAWGKLIRILLVARGEEQPTTDSIRTYQRDRLGRSNGDTCLLELLPLPSPSTGRWIYAALSSLPQLASREAYREHYARSRALHIAQRVREYRPAAVIFYSFDAWYRDWWQLVAGAPFTEVTTKHGRFYLTVNGPTRFVITKHPAGLGITGAYWHEIGRVLASSVPSEMH